MTPHPQRHNGCSCPDATAESGTPGLTRRGFLTRTVAAGALTGLAGHGLATQVAFAAEPYDGDVLVVLSLRGGFDGLNVVVPTAETNYATLRPTLGIPQGALLPLDDRFGLHPAMADLMPLWQNGTFGVVHAVGQTDPSRSHFDAMEEMERAAPGTSTRTGWLDRTLGLRERGSSFQAVQMGTSMASGAFLGPTPELAMRSLDGFSLNAARDATERKRWSTALRGLHGGAPPAIGSPAATTLGALTTAGKLQETAYTPRPGAVYPDTDLGRALRDVARLIKADVGLQVAAVDYGDWDMHVDMGTVDAGWLRDKLVELAGALAAFATDLGPRLGDVTLVSLTEFGRRVAENGSAGTDHGHGQAVLMLGGGVQGGRVHGAWPGLAPRDLVDGDLAGTTDYRVLLAEILQQRCRAGSLSKVFPNLPSDRLGIVRARY